MGASPWLYFVPYDTDFQHALDTLREAEFRAGRFRGAELSPASIDEALENSADEGTASILDIVCVAQEPELCAVVPLNAEELNDLFGTAHPTRQMVESADALFERIDRGQGVCFAVYDNGRPSGIAFAGYSVD